MHGKLLAESAELHCVPQLCFRPAARNRHKSGICGAALWGGFGGIFLAGAEECGVDHGVLELDQGTLR